MEVATYVGSMLDLTSYSLPHLDRPRDAAVQTVTASAAQQYLKAVEIVVIHPANPSKVHAPWALRLHEGGCTPVAAARTFQVPGCCVPTRVGVAVGTHPASCMLPLRWITGG